MGEKDQDPRHHAARGRRCASPSSTRSPRVTAPNRGCCLEARENVFLRAEADKNGGGSATIDPEAVTSQIQLVLSRDLAREVIDKEKLADNPEFDPALRGPSVIGIVLSLFGIGRDPAAMTKEERTLESYYDRLNVYAVEKSRVIGIGFMSDDPDLAARVANTIAADLSQDAADGEAESDARRRRLAGRRDRQSAHQGGGRRSQGRGLSRQDQSVRRLQQHVAAQPAAHRDQFADFGGARAKGRPGGEGAAVARTHPLGQADRVRPTSPIPNPCAG